MRHAQRLLAAYEDVFPRRTHRFCGKEEGETNHVERWSGTVRARLNQLYTIHTFSIITYNLGIKQTTIG